MITSTIALVLRLQKRATAEQSAEANSYEIFGHSPNRLGGMIIVDNLGKVPFTGKAFHLHEPCRPIESSASRFRGSCREQNWQRPCGGRLTEQRQNDTRADIIADGPSGLE